MSDVSDFNELMKALRHPRDWRVRQATVESLSRLHTSEAMQAILTVLYDESPHVASTAAYALESFGVDAVNGLLDTLHSGRELAAPSSILVTLGRIGDRRAMPDIIQFLSHENAGLRNGAMRALEWMPDSRAIPYLLKLIELEDDDSKYQVAQTLGVIGDPVAVPGLQSLLYSSEQMTRHYASVALGKIEDVLALETLLEATRSERGEVRCNAVEGLGYKQAEQAFERVLALLNDEHNEVRARAVSSLAKLDGTRALPYMVKMLDDPDHTVQSALSPALGFLPLDVVPILMQRLRHPNLGHSAEGLYRLASNYWNFAQEGDLAVEAALNALDTENLNGRVIAAWLLVVYCSRQMSQRMEWFRKGLNLQDFRMPELHQRVIEAIVVLLQDPDADIRLCAVKALYETPDKKAVNGLIRCLADDDQYIVQQAAEVLGRLADERAVSGLSKLLVSQEKMTCINAMTALGRIGGEAAWQALVNMLAHPDAWTRHCAAHSLADVGDNSVVPILLEKLKHETAIDAREGIVYSLGRLQDKRATVMIGGILTDMSDLSWAGWRLRGTAAFALSMIRDEAALPALFEAANTAPEWQVRMQAVEALAAIGSPQEQADRLFGLLEHENDTVRTTAAKRLGVLGAGTDDLNLRDYIVSNLITRLYDTGVGYHASPTVAHMAAKSLYYVGTTEAIVALRNWEQGQANSSV